MSGRGQLRRPGFDMGCRTIVGKREQDVDDDDINAVSYTHLDVYKRQYQVYT